MIVSKKVYEEMIRLPVAPPETGGILGEKDGIICRSFIDQTDQSTTQATYCPNTQVLNDVIRRWNKKNICFAGFFHTHLPKQERLSNDDIFFIEAIFESLSGMCKYLFFPVVIPGIKVYAYKAMCENKRILIFEDKIIIKGDCDNGKRKENRSETALRPILRI